MKTLHEIAKEVEFAKDKSLTKRELQDIKEIIDIAEQMQKKQ
jgi:hypothetical protein